MTGFRSDLAPFIAPRSAVVMGASERNGVARKLISNLRHGGCVVYGTHPRTTELDGIPVRASVTAFDPVQLACVALGTDNTISAVTDALAHGIRHIVIPGLGPETGAAGAAARQRLTELCDSHAATLVGPNGMGVFVPGGASAWIGSLPDSIRPGGVGVLVESGSIGEALTGIGPRVGLRAVVSSGNELAGDAADWLAWFAADPATTVIGGFLESVRRPQAFCRALRLAAEAEKPVVVVKVGSSSVAAERALAHSGAIAGSDQAFDALCRSYGVIRCRDYSDWLEALEVFGCGRRPGGKRLVVITNSGGEGEHAADAAERAGIPLQPLPADLASRLRADWQLDGANPIDYYAYAAEEDILPAVTAAAAAHPQVDGVVLNIDQSWRFVGSEAQRNGFIADVAADVAASTGAFVAVMSTATADADDQVTLRLAEAGVPLLFGAAAALNALAAAAAFTPRAPSRDPQPTTLHGTARPLAEYDAKQFLARFGITAPREERASSAEAAVQAAARIGYPVVVKIDGPAHKEGIGGVFLGCVNADAVRRATDACAGRVLVAEDLRGGVEVLVGVVRDAAFGPMLVVGAGGGWAEAINEQARTALVPVSLDQACALVEDVAPVRRRLGPAGVRAVAQSLVALSDAASTEPALDAVDVNPLRVVNNQAVALDALVVLREEQ